MKIRKIGLTAVMALAIIGASVQTHAAAWDFTVDSSETWLGYFAGSLWEGAYGVPDLRSTFPASNEIKLQSNVLARNNDAAWDGVTLTLSTYQEVIGNIGDTVSFDFYTVADTLTAAGYTAKGFIKVLDGFATWATTQRVDVDLTPGSFETLSLTVLDAGAGVEFIQAGFEIVGLADKTGSGTDTLSVNVIPEPATFGMLGLAGAVLFVRRRLMI